MVYSFERNVVDFNVVFNSCRFHTVYYSFGFLFVVFLLLLVAVAETSVLFCHNCLRTEVREVKENKDCISSLEFSRKYCE